MYFQVRRREAMTSMKLTPWSKKPQASHVTVLANHASRQDRVSDQTFSNLNVLLARGPQVGIRLKTSDNVCLSDGSRPRSLDPTQWLSIHGTIKRTVHHKSKDHRSPF